MAREIKFRAWDKNLSAMVRIISLNLRHECGYVLANHPDSVKLGRDDTYLLDKDDLVLMQYTGLKDATGNEIYEGDIVTILYREITGGYPGEYETDEGFYVGQVYFKPSTGFGLKNVIKNSDSGDGPIKRKPLNRIVQSRSTVIGNIFQHPERLK